jgi:two-component system phosphate regulon response regulator PhoB
MQTILIIEDEKDLAELLSFNIEKEGFRPLTALDGAEGYALACRELPDLILLDLMLPGMMGTDICRELRKRPETRRVPIIMLTARGEEIDRVVGFELGADDYLVKPFSPRELILRVKAILRRTSLPETEGKIISHGQLVIDEERHLVVVGGEEISLTNTEFRLLSVLAGRPDRIQSRERLLQDVWGYSSDADTRTVDTHITRLRGKLGEVGEMIRTVRGFGYKLDPK